MKHLSFFTLTFFLFSLTPQLRAAEPDPGQAKIEIKNNRGKQQELFTQSLHIDTSFMGNYAEVSYTFTFKNIGKRQTEGEFIFPIPEGAYLSQLWLEVQGRLRRSSSVRKAHALNAYETLTNRDIDPAIVEKIDDRTFRARLFPIPENGTKQIRISYIQRLVKDNDQLTLKLPVYLESKCNKFSLEISKDPAQPAEYKINGKEIEKISSKGKKIQRTFKISLPAPTSHIEYTHQERNEQFHSIQLLTKDIKIQPQSVDSYETVNILWDSSISMKFSERQGLLKKLDTFLTQEGCKTATLIPFGSVYSAQPSSGSWKEIHQSIQQMDYLGGMPHLTALDHDLGNHSTIIVSDSPDTLPELKQGANSPLFFIFLSGSKLSYTDLIYLKSHKITHIPLTSFLDKPSLLLRPQYETTINESDPESLNINSSESYTFISQKYAANTARGSIIIHGQVTNLKPTSYKHPMTQRVWAWEQLQKLQKEASSSEQIAHATKYNAISDHTSLIVLDRIQDYLDYSIVPDKGSTIYAAYQKEIEQTEIENTKFLKQEHAQLNQWKTKKHLWIDHLVHENYLNTKAWLVALPKAFNQNQLNEMALDPYRKWVDTTSELLIKRPSREALERNIQWQEQLNKAQKKRSDISSKKEKVNSPTVSVRGYVLDPSTFQFKNLTTVREALIKANTGRAITSGYSAIALYRSGEKIYLDPFKEASYNKTLHHGDMLVVELLDDAKYFYPIGNIWEDMFNAIPPYTFKRKSHGSSEDIFGDTADTDSLISSPFSPVSKAAIEPHRQLFNHRDINRLIKDKKQRKEFKISENPTPMELMSALAPQLGNSAGFYLYFAQQLDPKTEADSIYKALSNAADLSGKSFSLLCRVAKAASTFEQSEKCMKLADTLFTQLHQQSPTNTHVIWELIQISPKNKQAQYREKLDRIFIKGSSDKARNALFLSGSHPLEKKHLVQGFQNLTNLKLNLSEEENALPVDLMIEMDSHSISRNMALGIQTPTSLHFSQFIQGYPNKYGEIYLCPDKQLGFIQSLYCSKRALPGEYLIALFHDFHKDESKEPFPVYITITKNLNRPNESKERLKIWVDPAKSDKTLVRRLDWKLED